MGLREPVAEENDMNQVRPWTVSRLLTLDGRDDCQPHASDWPHPALRLRSALSTMHKVWPWSLSMSSGAIGPGPGMNGNLRGAIDQ